MSNSKHIAAIIIILIAVFIVGLYYTQNKKGVSQSEAEKIIRSLPEIENLFELSSNWTIRAEDRTGDYWVVQVIEYVDDESQYHSATFNWYKVRKADGEIVCSMFSYDEQGKLNENVETNSCI